MLGFGKKKQPKEPPKKLPIWMMGRDYLSPGTTEVLQVQSGLVAGIAPGNKKCVATKHEGNEDALGLMALHGGRCLLLADSHFGLLAAEQALLQFGATFEETSGSMAERMFKTIYQLDQNIRQSKAATAQVRPGCATTLIAAWIQESNLVWSSIGDSFLWLIRNGQASLLNERTANFLGDAQPLCQPFVDVLEEMQLLEVSEEALDADFWWRISQLNRHGLGFGTTYGDLTELLADLKPYFRKSVSLEELAKPWSPLQLAAKAILPEWGSRQLKAGDRLLLATDGVEEPASLASLETVLELAGDPGKTGTEAMKSILDACHGRKGGADNLMCWISDVE